MLDPYTIKFESTLFLSHVLQSLQNVLIMEDFGAKMCDFGLSKLSNVTSAVEGTRFALKYALRLVVTYV